LKTTIKEQNGDLRIGPDDVTRYSREEVAWVCEVTPSAYVKFNIGVLYVGFSRLKTRKFDEVTQCVQCLGFGQAA